jgi:hypothetical protein
VSSPHQLRIGSMIQCSQRRRTGNRCPNVLQRASGRRAALWRRASIIACAHVARANTRLREMIAQARSVSPSARWSATSTDPSPLSSNRPQASLNAGSKRSRSRSLAASSRRRSPKCERAEPLAADAQSTMPQRIKWISNHRRKLSAITSRRPAYARNHYPTVRAIRTPC